MPTVAITSVGQVIVCSSNMYTPFQCKRLPSGCVAFVGELKQRRPSCVIHVSFEQHETKRCPTRSIVKGNIVLIPFLLYRQDLGISTRRYLMRSSTIIVAVLTAPACLRRFGRKDRTSEADSRFVIVSPYYLTLCAFRNCGSVSCIKPSV